MFRIGSTLFLLATACWGLSNASSRMVGGSDAVIEDFPYTASMEIIGIGHICSAVIISNEWILTTVHCAGPWQPEYPNWIIRVGSSIKNDSGVTHSMIDWVWHPDYENHDHVWEDHDFGLARVDPPFEFGPTIAAAPLPDSDQFVPDYTPGTVVGWGKGSEDYDKPANLTFAEFTVYDNTTCSILLEDLYTDTKLCGRNAANDVAFCWDDEGGPLMVNGTLTGIILGAYTGPCSIPRQTQVFGRVASVRDWIDSIIGA